MLYITRIHRGRFLGRRLVQSSKCLSLMLQTHLHKQTLTSFWAASGLNLTVTGVSVTSSYLLLETLAWYTFCNELHPLLPATSHSQALDKSVCEAAHCGKLRRGTILLFAVCCDADALWWYSMCCSQASLSPVGQNHSVPVPAICARF